jgi:hypothetical protein
MTVSNHGEGERESIDDAGDLAMGLARARAEIDAEIKRSGAAGRVAAAVLADLDPARPPRFGWLAVAAALVIAAGLGGLVEANRLQSVPSQDVVAFDPLTFGPVAVDR